MGRPDDNEHRPTGTVTFLFTDVEGSTRLWALDAAAMSASLRLHDRILRDAIVGHAGYVFTTAGDSFAAAFQHASDATAAAIAAQAALSESVWPGPALRVRMGLHVGTAEERGGDYFGPDVNTAARVEAAGHGGQVLITEAVRSTASLAASELTDLGVHRLRDVPASLRLFQLGHERFAALRVVDPGLSNLPVRPTRLLGREAEVAQVRMLLAEHRLVTVAALGGSGKTRVAIAVGEAELAHRSGGVWFVDLTAISRDEDVPSAVAGAVGLNLSAGDASAQVIRYLADKQALVILDNCEHVIEGCRTFVQRFITTRGATSLLATSREVLDVDGEHTVALAPLPFDSATSPAVRLFAERAGSVDPAFVLDAASTPVVAAICRRLDGLPLAIEFAAARVAVMSLAELVSGLDDRFALLGQGRRSRPQHTLQAALDWSYGLLDPDEQRVLRRLGVFVDGFDLAGVAAVTDTPTPVATEIIRALIGKSLVVRADHDGATRFRLLETVKAYAEQRLELAGESGVIRDRHLDHFDQAVTPRTRVIHAEMTLSGQMRADHRNLGTAFDRAAVTGDWPRAAGLILGAAGVFEVHAAFLEAVTLFDRVLEHGSALDVDQLERLKAARLLFLGGCGDPRFGTACRELCRSPVSAVQAYAWTWLAWVNVYLGVRPDAEFAHAQDAVDRLDGGDSAPIDVTVRSNIMGVRGFAAARAGDYDAAIDWYRQAVTANAAYPTVANVGAALGGLALCQILNGQPAAALDTIALLESHRISWRRGDDLLALAHLALGDREQAMHHVRLLTMSSLTGRIWGEAANTLVVHGFVHAAERNPDQARGLFEQITAPTGTIGIIYATHLARELGIADLLTQRILRHVGSGMDEQLARAATTSAALRTEATNRGWS